MATQKNQKWNPWHKVVRLREDVRTGELSLAVFAADLYDVALGQARPVYQNPHEFFALTFPTFALRELARDVSARLAGKSDKAVRQLELTYGGGKTHTLITLLHLVSDPTKLPKLPAVDEFIQHMGSTPPRARVAILPFDKLDVEKGVEVLAPDGSRRQLKHPWSVIAFQLAGSQGLRLLHPDDRDAERDSAPAEPLLVSLLSLPQKEDLSTLILIDEVLMFVREKVALDSAWRGRMVNFFQYLTQAVTKVDRAAIVASLLATDPRKNDPLGKELAQELAAVFRREREEGVQPVGKDDVAEVLRRRFFTPESARDREAFRPHVVAALRGIADLDELTRKDLRAAEERFVRSYPFHPDLTEALYTKWTQLEGFQRTRGILRTFALALRDAERWDTSPLVGANVFLGEPGKPGLSEGARELATVAATEEYEGKKQEWSMILEGELAKAREIQREMASITHREVEQVVFSTFIHSQPIGQKALTRDLTLLLGPTRPDRIELEKALLRWTETSWFLDEGGIQDAEASAGTKALPKSWRLGSKPNLRQMHHDACIRIQPELIEAKLLDEIQRTKSLTAGAQSAGAKPHVLPDRPRDVDDDGEFRFVVLGPKAACEIGKPSTEARRFLEETTGPDRPRVRKNAVVLVVPSRDGLDLARQRIREYLGWEEVRSQLKEQQVDPIREETLTLNVDQSRKRIPEAIVQAYGIIVTLSAKNEVEAFKVKAGEEALFLRVKATPQARIEETALNAEALLPDGPYNLWRDGETSRRVRDLVGAFAELPHLPKMLNRRAILETLLLGCRQGQFVLRVTRPDRSVKTYWQSEPSEEELKEPSLDLVLPDAAALEELSPALLAPGTLPGLWTDSELRGADLFTYFGGGKVVKVARNGYDEPILIPRAERAVVARAAGEAVANGRLWLTTSEASLLGETVPPGLLCDEAVLRPPPAPLPATDVLPGSLSEAWTDETTTALSIAHALSSKAGMPLPWSAIRDAIDGAIRGRLLETIGDSERWPCDIAGAAAVKLIVPARPVSAPSVAEPPRKPASSSRIAEAELRVEQFQELADSLTALKKAVAGHQIRLVVRVEIGGAKPVGEETISRANAVLQAVNDKLTLS